MYVQNKIVAKTATKTIVRLFVSLTPNSIAHEYAGSGSNESEALKMAIAKAKANVARK